MQQQLKNVLRTQQPTPSVTYTVGKVLAKGSLSFKLGGFW